MRTEEPVIRFQNVSKRFVFTPDTPQTILETFISLFARRMRRQKHRELWAVEDVSFDVMAGQCLGIVGRNGSGKSSILKLVARILRPTAGRIIVRGRVSALLELGAGFHQDLTGRENIFLNASVLGLGREEIAACYDQIVAFSELGDFINMPVKHYSSGMYMRLGFSVAVHVKPDILIIDEILAVGDQAFQRKCVDHIFEMKRKGTTIIIVSHNLSMIRKLCTHLIWTEEGRIKHAGATEEVAAEYLAYSFNRESKQLSTTAASPARRTGTRQIEIVAVRLLDGTQGEQNVFKTGDVLTIEMDYIAHEPIPEPEFGLAIIRQDGVQVNGPNSQLAGLEMGTVEGTGTIRYRVENLPLLPARYMVTAAIHDSRAPITYDYHKEAYHFRVAPGGTEELYGMVEIPASWEWMPAEPGNDSLVNVGLASERVAGPGVSG